MAAFADIEKQDGYTRKRFRALEDPVDANTAYAEYLSLAPVTPLGHQVYSVGSVVVPLASIPSGAKRMHLRTLTAPINWTDGAAADPSTSFGFPLLKNEWLLYDNEPTTSFRMISADGVTADVRVAFYA